MTTSVAVQHYRAWDQPRIERLGGVTVVTLSYLRPDLFRRMADALPAVSDVLVERVLVNNGGDAETHDAAEERGWTVLEPGRNTSFAEGCNLGVAASHSTHILLLNNDAVLDAVALAAFWARRAHPLVGCVTVRTDGRLDHAGGGIEPGAGVPFHFAQGDDPRLIAQDRFCPWVTFAAALIHRALWDDLEGLDEAYVYSFEDLDFCLRAFELAGVASLVAQDARVLHDQFGTRVAGSDSANWRRFSQAWLQTGRLAQTMGWHK